MTVLHVPHYGSDFSFLRGRLHRAAVNADFLHFAAWRAIDEPAAAATAANSAAATATADGTAANTAAVASVATTDLIPDQGWVCWLVLLGRLPGRAG